MDIVYKTRLLVSYLNYMFCLFLNENILYIKIKMTVKSKTEAYWPRIGVEWTEGTESGMCFHMQ